MSDLENIFSLHDSKYRNHILADTWGHLDAEIDRVYTGWIVYTHGCYGDLTIINWEFEDLPDNPWIYEEIQAFIADMENDACTIYRFIGTYVREKDGNALFDGMIEEIDYGYTTN